jgi:hypothetical protein
VKRILEVVLSVGNYMNGGTRKGGAYGFSLASLGKLVNTKSVDGQQNLLEYIVAYVAASVEEEEANAGKPSEQERGQRVSFVAELMEEMSSVADLEVCANPLLLR